MKQLMFLLLAAMAIISCDNNKADAKDPETKEEAKVDVAALNKAFDAAWDAKDSAMVVGMLADDVRLLEARDNLSGKAEVASKWVGKNIGVAGNLKTNILTSETDGARAYEAGTFSLDVTLPEQKPFEVTGNYIFIWKKQADNSWKINYIQIENHDPETAKK